MRNPVAESDPDYRRWSDVIVAVQDCPRDSVIRLGDAFRENSLNVVVHSMERQAKSVSTAIHARVFDRGGYLASAQMLAAMPPWPAVRVET